MMPDEVHSRLCNWAMANESIHELWLFGSQANGTARPDSDYDIGVGLAPAIGDHNWAFGNYCALGDQWRRELEAIVGRHVSLENITPDDPGRARVNKWQLLWSRKSRSG